MTSLTETLPILDQAVPALPARLEEVAQESDAFQQAAVDAAALLGTTRGNAADLVSKVRDALDGLQAQALDGQKRVADAVHALEDTSDVQLRELAAVEARVATEAAETRAALDAVRSRLEGGAERTRAAHAEAGAVLDLLEEEARTRQPELDAAADAVAQAVKAAQQAAKDGQAQVDQGVGALRAALERLMGEAQGRLARTHEYLDAIREEHAQAVGQALSELTEGRERLGGEVAQALQSGVSEALQDDVDAALAVLTDVGQRASVLETETAPRREELAQQVEAVRARIGPLQEGVQQVRVAAGRLGIDWP
ncbi:MAG: hypothetical protein ABW221_07340 [Vicinamibacteria bacterium]